MQELLTNPAIQAAGAPFLVALVLALLMRQIMPTGLGLAVIAGFFVAVWLTIGLTVQPLTSTRKIILSGLTLPVLMLWLDMIPFASRFKQVNRALPAVLLAAAALWIIWPVVQRQEGAAAWLMAMPVIVFSAGVMYTAGVLTRMQGDANRVLSSQAANALILAMGTGAVTLIAASALYSQLAFAVSAATGAVIVIAMFSATGKRDGLDKLSLYAAVVPVSLFAAAATVYAKLPLLVLLCLALVPVFAWRPFVLSQQRWLQLIATCLWACIPVLPAIWLAWRSAGAVSF